MRDARCGMGHGVPALADAVGQHLRRLGRVECPHASRIPHPASRSPPELVSKPSLLSLRVAPGRHHDRFPQIPLRKPPCEHRSHLSISHPVEPRGVRRRSEEHTSELQSQSNLVCRLLLEKKKINATKQTLTVTMPALSSKHLPC